MQKHYATKASPHVRVKKRKNCPSLVPRYTTVARHLNIVKIILHGTFDEKKVKYVSDPGALLKTTWCILNGIALPWRRSVSTAPNDSDKCSVSFRFFTTIESEECIYDCIIAKFAIGFS